MVLEDKYDNFYEAINRSYVDDIKKNVYYIIFRRKKILTKSLMSFIRYIYVT